MSNVNTYKDMRTCTNILHVVCKLQELQLSQYDATSKKLSELAVFGVWTNPASRPHSMMFQLSYEWSLFGLDTALPYSKHPTVPVIHGTIIQALTGDPVQIMAHMPMVGSLKMNDKEPTSTRTEHGVSEVVSK